MEKVFFADIKGVGRMINKGGDYDQYHVRCGLRTDRYDHSDSIVKKSFKGTLNGVSAKDQAKAFVNEARKILVPEAEAKSEKKGARR